VKGSDSSEAVAVPAGRAAVGPEFSRQQIRSVVRWLGGLGVPPQDRADCAQDVFRIAIEKREAFASGSLDAWLYRIATNVARNANRKRHKMHNREAPSGAAGDLDRSGVQDAQVDSGEPVQTKVQKFLDGLSPRDRELFVLRELRGLDIDEIGTRVGLSRSQMYRRLRDMQQQMRALFAPADDDESEAAR